MAWTGTWSTVDPLLCAGVVGILAAAGDGVVGVASGGPEFAGDAPGSRQRFG